MINCNQLTHIITACVRSMTGDYIFSLSVHTRGGGGGITPISDPRPLPSMWSHYLSLGGGGVTPVLSQGLPRVVSHFCHKSCGGGGGYPRMGDWSTPSPTPTPELVMLPAVHLLRFPARGFSCTIIIVKL